MTPRLAKGNATMTVILAAVLVLTFLPWSAIAAQETPGGPVTTRAQVATSGSALDRLGVVDKPNRTPPPTETQPLAESERAARIEKIQALQVQVDDCNFNFMGLPVEHEECIRKVLRLLEDETNTGAPVKVDATGE